VTIDSPECKFDDETLYSFLNYFAKNGVVTKEVDDDKITYKLRLLNTNEIIFVETNHSSVLGMYINVAIYGKQNNIKEYLTHEQYDRLPNYLHKLYLLSEEKEKRGRFNHINEYMKKVIEE
jgi:hypothetical protein